MRKIVFENDKATNEWLDAQKVNTARTYRSLFKLFLDYVNKSGDEILASRIEDLKNEDIKIQRHWEKILEDFDNKMRNEDTSDNKRKTVIASVRSFFAYHYRPMQFRRVVSQRMGEGTRVTSDYKFTKDELHKMSLVGNIEDKYIVTVGKSFGLRASDFIRLKRGDFEAYIDREAPIDLGKYPTKKASEEAHLFLDSDGVLVVKMILEKMNAEGRTDPNERILTFKQSELTSRLKRLAKKIGITNGTKIIRFHELRAFLSDRLSAITSESKWKQVIGKSVSESAYVSDLELREIYERVMPQTCFSQNGANHKELIAMSEQLDQAQESIKSLTIQNEAMMKFQKQLLEKLHASGMLPKDFTMANITGEIEATLTPLQREILRKKKA